MRFSEKIRSTLREIIAGNENEFCGNVGTMYFSQSYFVAWKTECIVTYRCIGGIFLYIMRMRFSEKIRST